MQLKKEQTGRRIFYIGTAVLFLVLAFIMIIMDCRWYGWAPFVMAAGGFIAMRRTKYWKGFRKAMLWITILVVAGACMYFGRPDLDVSFRGTLAREGIRFILKLPSMQGDGLLQLGARYAKSPSDWQPPKGYTLDRYDLNGLPVELLHPDEGSGEKVILQFHGGAYVIGFMDVYRNVAVRYSRLSGGADVVSIDYRIAPEYTYPAALEDAMKTWDWMLEQGYSEENIIIAGDSAGGNLALALTAKLRDEGRAVPGAIICMSPWTDMAGEGASYEYNYYRDPMFGNKDDSDPGVIMVHEYAGETDLHDPYLSPLYNSFEEFPPILIQVGTWELIESDSISLYEKAKAAGVDVTLTRYRGMFHMFQLLGNLLPEAKAAWSEVGTFIAEQYADQAS